MNVKRTLCALLVASPLLAGCAAGTTIFGQPAPTTAQVQEAAVAACAFLPTAATVASIISANPAVATATEIASAICAAVTAAPTVSATRRGGKKLLSVPNVNGVPVHGRFVS